MSHCWPHHPPPVSGAPEVDVLLLTALRDASQACVGIAVTASEHLKGRPSFVVQICRVAAAYVQAAAAFCQTNTGDMARRTQDPPDTIGGYYWDPEKRGA